MITALMSLKAISRPDGFFDRFSCAMHLRPLMLWLLSTEFSILFSWSGVQRWAQPLLKMWPGSAEIGRVIFPFWWVQLRGMSALVVDTLLIQVQFLID